MAPVKTFEYKAIVIEEPGHITSAVYLHALNVAGQQGWKHKEEQAVGSHKLAVLLERETIVDHYAKPEVDPDVIEEMGVK